jgi:uncharacterized membrane protein
MRRPGDADAQKMTAPHRIGVTAFGAAMIVFGIENLIYRDGVMGLEPLPDWLPAHPIWALVTGLLLIAAGAGVIAGWRARVSALVVTALFIVWLLLLQVPLLVGKPHNGTLWTTTLETLALGSGACVLAALSSQWPPRVRRLPAGAAVVARVCFGLTLLGFGVLHFVYHEYVASVIPGWLPGHLAWAYLTGIAFLAAGTSAVTGIRARLATMLTGVMFGTWVLIVHAPRVAVAPTSRAEWTSMIVALAMCGSAFLFAQYTTSRSADRVEREFGPNAYDASYNGSPAAAT